MPPPSKPILALLLLGTSATAFLAGRQSAPDANERVLQELASQRAVLDTLLARTAAPPDAHRDVEPPSKASSTPAPSAPSMGTEPSPRSLAAVQEGQQLIDAALQVRRWTKEDGQAFRAALVDMTPDQRGEAMRRFFTTINSQALDVRTGGAPF
ncbi:hypothetical protein HUW62_08765 [Myxococcus sp. AM011]|uniref:hypothetical protein n=1 Tax=Myxococcus sp. AM011 TaxID=2745200 RepID=UPI001596147D|nr:hypothetical protein [Myxococcus sp. AM011]NVJ21307.1 hypothetical protein [Myxococcus sp. AM011]